MTPNSRGAISASTRPVHVRAVAEVVVAEVVVAGAIVAEVVVAEEAAGVAADAAGNHK